MYLPYRTFLLDPVRPDDGMVVMGYIEEGGRRKVFLHSRGSPLLTNLGLPTVRYLEILGFG